MKNIILLIVAFCMAHIGIAQTGVNTSDVSKNAALHIEALNNNQGMLIPRLTEVERDQIPATDKEDGLTVYNTTENCLNYWSKLESEWKSICGKISKADFTITNCNNIGVFGIYEDNVALDNSHFITMEVEVKKIGTYTIMASSAPYNGYYYATSGEFLSLGKYTIHIPAAGQPIKFGTDNFKVSLNDVEKNGAAEACTFEVRVEDSRIKPDFSMRCVDTKVRGVYKIDQPLKEGEHYMEMIIDANQEAIGSTLVIQTNEIDGIYFKASEEIKMTRQTIRLQGYGVPSSTDLKKFTITSNSTLTAAVCYANVRVVIPKKRMLTIGSARNGYGYNFSGTAASNKLITSENNYGQSETSVVGFEGWGEIKNGTNSPSTANLKTWLLGPDPYDILIIGYSWTMGVDAAEVIADYLVRGGVVLAYSESNDGMTRLMSKITGNNYSSGGDGSGAGTIYKFSSIDDPVLNGPFGDVRGKYWGEDASHTTILQGLDTGNLIIYSDGYNWSNKTTTRAGISSFRHKDYNLIWVGDGGFNSNLDKLSVTICPFWLDSENYPIPKEKYGNGAFQPQVHNAIFTANAVGWAIEQAEKNGINSNKGGRN